MNRKEQQERVAELHSQDYNFTEIGVQLGFSRDTARRRLQEYQAMKGLDDYISETLDDYGVADISDVRGGWIVKPDGKGGRLSLNFKAPQTDPINQLDRISDAFNAVKPVNVPAADVYNDLMTVYPLYDMHIGMMAWGRETRGQDFDLDLMKSDLMQSISTVQSYAPDSQDALIILGGDTIHINDHFNQTPASGHKMDVDGRFEKVIDTAIEAISWAVEYLASKHSTVKVVVLRGNHDETAHLVLKAALKQRYRGSDNVSFPALNKWDKSEIYWFKHGSSLIIAHHGDKAPPERLAMIAADKCPDWSSCKYRVILTGHLHSLKVKDMAGVTHYTLRAFCPPDAYGAMFGGVRGLSAMSFSAAKGLINTAYDPIERD